VKTNLKAARKILNGSKLNWIKLPVSKTGLVGSNPTSRAIMRIDAGTIVEELEGDFGRCGMPTLNGGRCNRLGKLFRILDVQQEVATFLYICPECLFEYTEPETIN
jgi:hypothetical protein